MSRRAQLPRSWDECRAIFATKRRKLANNTYLEEAEDGAFAIRLHSTRIVTFYESGRIKLDTGGWRTVTTKDRINRCLPRGWRVWQRDFDWFIGVEIGSLRFEHRLERALILTPGNSVEDPSADWHPC